MLKEHVGINARPVTKFSMLICSSTPNASLSLYMTRSTYFAVNHSNFCIVFDSFLLGSQRVVPPSWSCEHPSICIFGSTHCNLKLNSGRRSHLFRANGPPTVWFETFLAAIHSGMEPRRALQLLDVLCADVALIGLCAGDYQVMVQARS